MTDFDKEHFMAAVSDFVNEYFNETYGVEGYGEGLYGDGSDSDSDTEDEIPVVIQSYQAGEQIEITKENAADLLGYMFTDNAILVDELPGLTVMEPPEAPPIDGYDDMSVVEVDAATENVEDPFVLAQWGAYEKANKNRITALEDIAVRMNELIDSET